jgi:hypothetical protein
VRRLVFCFDGSWNRIDAPHPTNVLFTAECVLPEAKGVAQLIFYDEGVGTEEGEEFQGGAFGYGLMLGGLAEFERELIRARTSEGRERAKARGVRLGRRPKLTPHQRKEALGRREAGEPLVEIARSYAVSHSTISRLRAV